MRKILIALFLLWPLSAFAQGPGPVPSPWQYNGGLNIYYQNGCVIIGTPVTCTGGGVLVLPPLGSAPTSPPNGAMWSTSAGVFAQIGGATVGPFISEAAGAFLPLAGGTMTGAITGADAGTWGSGGLNGVIIGGTTPAAGHFTTGSLTGALTYGGVTLSNAVTGTGSMVLSTSPVLTTPNLGTPSAITLTNGTGLPIAGVTGWGTGVQTALGNPVNASSGLLTYGIIGTSGGTLCLVNATCTVGALWEFATGDIAINGGTATAGLATVTIAGVLNSEANATVAQGGTNCASASGTCLDNITDFASTGFLTRTGSGAYNFQSLTNGITLANIAQLSASSLLGNPTGSLANMEAITLDSTLGFSGTTLKCTTATSSQLGCVKPDGTIITISGGAITVAKATNAAYGAMEGDGDTISCTAGVCSAIGGTATTIDARGSSGATTINNGNPGYALTQTASGSYIANNQLFSAAGGYINKFRNATFDIWQRGSSVTIGTTGNYGPDGWKIYFTGSTNVAAAQLGSNATIIGSYYGLDVQGAASNTDVKVGQRIESYIATPLASNVVTVQFKYYQDTGSSQTPKVSACYASAQDNFTTCTSDLSATGLTSCTTATWCTEAYTFTPSSSAVNGYEIDFDCNAAILATHNCLIGAPDVRVTPGVAGGVNANPPPPELRPIGSELALNERYYWTQTATTASIYYGNVYAFSATLAVLYTPFPVTMRVAPTATYSSAGNFVLDAGGTAFTPSAVSLAVSQVFGASSGFTISGAVLGQNGFVRDGGSANSSISFSAEL